MTSAGGCLCGAVRYNILSAPTFVCVCHCDSCRRASGAPMVAWATFEKECIALPRAGLQRVASSPGVLRGHCPRCGTCLTYEKSTRPGEIDVTLASMDDPEAFTPSAHIWVSEKLSWVTIADGLRQYDTTI
ncbi:MAG TPA: GFA family protein [Steroidobacteraceae bacterium]|nr:GFA family protein [Steroidobacteraceae bacterium]